MGGAGGMVVEEKSILGRLWPRWNCFASIMNAHRLLCYVTVMLPIGPEDPSFGGESLSMGAPLPRTIETVRKFYSPSNVSDSQETGIHQCLADAWELKCTDPRDKVYGLLGLVQHIHCTRRIRRQRRCAETRWQSKTSTVDQK